MTKTVDGIDNEFAFVMKFNNKRVCELDPLSREFVEMIFDRIPEDSLIKSWRNHYAQKADIFLKADGRMKGISIKMVSRNSVHVEPVQYFVKFLKLCGISDVVIEKYLYYHFADGTLDGNGETRISKEEYLKDHKEDVDLINNAFNDSVILRKAIDRFILLGRNSRYPVDAIIYGTPDNFMWLTRREIIECLSNTVISESSGVHFGTLFCQPQNRCLNRNSKYEFTRYNIQIKWYSLFDDIMAYRNRQVELSLKDESMEKENSACFFLQK